MNDNKLNSKFILSGLKAIDSLLGGWRKKTITLLVGESGSGKSTMLITTAYHAAKKGGRVNYIDTEGNPVEEVLSNLKENIGKVNVEHAVKSMESLEDAVNRLRNLPREILNGSLVIVDSLTYHYHALIRSAQTEAERDRLQARLEAIVYSLHTLAVENDVAVVASTWPTSVYDAEGDFVGGFAVKTYSRTQVRIHTSALSNVRVIEVVKYQNPRIYNSQSNITLDEIMSVLDMSPPSGSRPSLPQAEEVDLYG